MLNNPLILIGTDFSPISDLAIKAGMKIKEKTNAELFVVHATPHPYGWDWITSVEETNFMPTTYSDELVKVLKEQLKVQLMRCEVSCRNEVIFGKPYQALHDTITTQGVDLLILGHHGSGAGRHYLLGGVTSKMISTCDIPILVLNRTFDPKKTAGLIDTNNINKNIFFMAEEFSFLFPTELQFISVWQDISILLSRQLSVPRGERFLYSDEEKEMIKNSIKEIISKNMDVHSKAKLNVETICFESIPEGLIRILESESIDLAVMARHSKSIFDKWFIGSVTKRILDEFKGNMLILPPGTRSSHG